MHALEAQLGRHLVLIAESDLNGPRIVRPPDIGGYGLAAQWSDDFHHALHTMLTGERGGYYADFGAPADLAQAHAAAAALLAYAEHTQGRALSHVRQLLVVRDGDTIAVGRVRLRFLDV